MATFYLAVVALLHILSEHERIFFEKLQETCLLIVWQYLKHKNNVKLIFSCLQEITHWHWIGVNLLNFKDFF